MRTRIGVYDCGLQSFNSNSAAERVLASPTWNTMIAEPIPEMLAAASTLLLRVTVTGRPVRI